MATNLNTNMVNISQELAALCSQINFEFDLEIKQSFEFNLEEIEIRIESIKIQLEETQSKLNRKTKILKKRLLKINDALNAIIDDDYLFQNVSLYSLDEKASICNQAYREINYYFLKQFEKTVVFVGAKCIGRVPDRVLEPKIITIEMIEAINQGICFLYNKMQIIYLFI